MNDTSGADKPATGQPEPVLVELKLQVPDELHRAFQRCLWLCLSETGRSRLELTREMLLDFLRKHGC